MKGIDHRPRIVGAKIEVMNGKCTEIDNGPGDGGEEGEKVWDGETPVPAVGIAVVTGVMRKDIGPPIYHMIRKG